MIRVILSGLAVLVLMAPVFLGHVGASADDDLELAAPRTPAPAVGIQWELDRAGFYGDAVTGSDDDGFAEAIADFEHYIGWPETGEPSPALFGALKDYNAVHGSAETDF